MSKKYQLTSAERFYQAMPKVIVWMKGLGLHVASSRYSRYQKDIDAFFLQNRDDLHINTEVFEEMIKAYQECLDICMIYSAFKNEKSQEFIDKLKIVNGGQDHPEPSEAGASRNYLFELIVAAQLSLNGYEIDFKNISDVVAHKDGIIIYGECKRLSSSKKFKENFKNAGNQLKERKSQEDQDAEFNGIIFLDISSCINVPLTGISNAICLSEYLKEQFYQYLTPYHLGDNDSIIEKYNKQFIDNSLGVCIIARALSLTNDKIINSAIEIWGCTTEELSDKHFDVFKRIINDVKRKFPDSL